MEVGDGVSISWCFLTKTECPDRPKYLSQTKTSCSLEDAVVGVSGAVKQSVESAYPEDLRDLSGNEVNPAQHPL